MKLKKYGFTLIELLAVIVILAIIALIAVPIVLNIIDDARVQASYRSIDSYKRSVDLAYVQQLKENPDAKPIGICSSTLTTNCLEVETDGDVSCGIFAINDKNEVYLSACTVGKDSTAVVMDGAKDYTLGTINTLSNQILSDNNASGVNGNVSGIITSTDCTEKSGYVLTGGACNIISGDSYGYASVPYTVTEYADLNGNSVSVTRENCSNLPKNFSSFWGDLSEITDTSSCESAFGGSGCVLNAQAAYECYYEPTGMNYTSANTEDDEKTYYFIYNSENNYVKFGGKYTYTYGNALWRDNGYGSYDACVSAQTEANKETTYCYDPETWNSIWDDPAACTQIAIKSTCTDDSYTEEKDLLWRIVRINEDGSIRLIANESIGKSQFNGTPNDRSSVADKKYIGYMYGTTLNPYSNENDSVMKKYLDSFYEKNLLKYSNYIADSGFCNDRTINSQEGTTINYGTAEGVACPSKRDLFTVRNEKGNKALKYPIGLITLQEKNLITFNNDSYDLYEKYGWTMTPAQFYDTFSMNQEIAVLYPVEHSMGASKDFGVQPVINIKSTVPYVGGKGTIDDPYVLE